MSQHTHDPAERVAFATETVSISRKDLIGGHNIKAEVACEEPGRYVTSNATDDQYLMPASRLLAELYLRSCDKEVTAR